MSSSIFMRFYCGRAQYINPTTRMRNSSSNPDADFSKTESIFLSDFEFDGDTRDLLVTKFTDFQDIFKFLRENIDFDLDGNSSKTERAIGDPLVAK